MSNKYLVFYFFHYFRTTLDCFQVNTEYGSDTNIFTINSFRLLLQLGTGGNYKVVVSTIYKFVLARKVCAASRHKQFALASPSGIDYEYLGCVSVAKWSALATLPPLPHKNTIRRAVLASRS